MSLNQHEPSQSSLATLERLGTLIDPLELPWWIVGGWAIELAVGHRIRTHSDVDILVLPQDEAIFRSFLEGWDTPDTETLAAQIEIVVAQMESGDWISPHDSEVRRPTSHLGHVTSGGLPYIAPEVELFEKAHKLRSKDEEDFDAVLPYLGVRQRGWLDQALAQAIPEHPWRTRLMIA